MRLTLLLLALASTGCGSILDTELEVPPNAEQRDPPGVYATWYAQTEACTGVQGDFSRVRWFRVPGERWWDPHFRQYVIGTWRRPHDIYIVDSHASNIEVVKHEAVHELLQGGASDDERFGRCSGIVH